MISTASTAQFRLRLWTFSDLKNYTENAPDPRAETTISSTRQIIGPQGLIVTLRPFHSTFFSV